MSKAKRIRQLASICDGASSVDIANMIAKEFGNCSDGYVRAVLQRQRYGGMLPAEKRWIEANRERHLAMHRNTNVQFRQRRKLKASIRNIAESYAR